jgi:hypothetical protein
LNGDDVDDDADLQDALAWRLVHCNGGASSTMARWSSASFLASELAEKIEKKGRSSGGAEGGERGGR